MGTEIEAIPAGRGHSLTGALRGTSWSPSRELALSDWVEHGRRLGSVGRSIGWWIGDWLRYGNTRFGERYARASRITGYDVQTLMNMVYVASAYEVSQRYESLSWSHHAEVAALEPEERRRWLDFAEAQRLSVRCLRKEVRRQRKLSRALETESSAVATLEAVTEDRLRCPECGCVINAEDGAHQAAAPSA